MRYDTDKDGKSSRCDFDRIYGTPQQFDGSFSTRLQHRDARGWVAKRVQYIRYQVFNYSMSKLRHDIRH